MEASVTLSCLHVTPECVRGSGMKNYRSWLNQFLDVQFQKEQADGTTLLAKLHRDFSRQPDSSKKTKRYCSVSEKKTYYIHFRTQPFTGNGYSSVGFLTQNELRATYNIASTLELYKFVCLQLIAEMNQTTCTPTHIAGLQYSFFHRSGIGLQV